MNELSKRPAVGIPIPFIDLQAQRRRLADFLEQRMGTVLDHCRFILGPEVQELETALAAFCGVRHVVACANGTDALGLCLRALEIGPGDAVIVPAFSFSASAEAVVLVGATPVFCDVQPDSFNIDIGSMNAAVVAARNAGLTPRAVMPVDLFGLPADYAGLEPAATAHGLAVLADAAQSFGASRGNRSVGTFGTITATSFFPSKPLGCYGDGGAVFTADDEMAELLRSLRQHGQGSDRYDNVRIGINSRLDSLQAAVLLAKLEVFAEEIELRQQVAARYSAALDDIVEAPVIDRGARSVWAQYTIKLEERDRVATGLKAVGVPTAIYYPRSLNRQTAYSGCPTVEGGVPVAEALSARVLSLPFHPYLDEATQDYIIDQLRAVIGRA